MKLPKKKIILVFFIVALAGGAFLVYKTFRAWEVYENSRYMFSVEYPKGWALGEAPTNNDGREFISPNEEITCRAYGFQNALITEDGDTQTLDEFVEWISAGLEVVEQADTILAEYPAVRLVSQDTAGKVQEAAYSLNEEEGRAVVCFFENMKDRNKFKWNFQKMVRSFAATLSEEFISHDTPMCENLLSDAITPLEDLQTFLDEEYTGVTFTERASWDRSKLPEKMKSLESKGYVCYPLPFEMEDTKQPVGRHVQPEVKSVQWTCELEHASYKYLAFSNTSEKGALEKQGYTCERRLCMEADNVEGAVWLCTQ